MFTVDVEDYFHVNGFANEVNRADWDKFESRVISNTSLLLKLLDDYDIKATFFILGWIAERFPEIVLLIHNRGHEVGCHSYAHRLIYNLSPDEFREDTMKAKAILEEITGSAVKGYRAPSFSIVEKSQWAWDILHELGFTYSSSVFPIKHDRYGFQSAPATIFDVELKCGEYITEIPATTTKFFNTRIAAAGGGYLRLFPYWFTRRIIRKLNERLIPSVVYVHPWEVDPHQPKIRSSLNSRFRHYTNLHTTLPKLRKLFSEFNFSTVSDYLAKSGKPDSVGAEHSPRPVLK
ncbi:MAG: DUF3473 domain-containing protein [candidate division Zixibacteria bacterium]|nr:DUF3473 domain-containing protein [candidate division Zixibacteria bacterium]